MNYGNIKNCDIANGSGVRVTLFVSGCTHHCKGCFNSETWDFKYGKPFDKEVEDKLIRMLAPDFIDGLTLLGGEPFEPVNQRALLPFVRKVKELYPTKNIWAFSGYLYEELTGDVPPACEATAELLSYVDVLVDGEFKEELKDIRLVFRGSSNQRVIDMNRTRAAGEIILWEEEKKPI